LGLKNQGALSGAFERDGTSITDEEDKFGYMQMSMAIG
jgi:hypothetical protein